MSLSPIAPAATGATSNAAGSGSAEITPPNTVIARSTTAIQPAGYSETVTTQEDGAITTAITNASGAVVETTFSVSTMSGTAAPATGAAVNVWA